MRQSIYSLCSALLAGMIAATAQADDLEIYLGTGNTNVTYDPNVLFIMDTSGSMGAFDGTSETRMLRVQNALKATLQSATNINAGLMRFSDFGGPVLYPVRPIDDPVDAEFVVPIVAGSDDAYEVNGGITSIAEDEVDISQGLQTVHLGLRYQDLAIPQGATITKAFVRFTSDQLNTAATSISIRGELSEDSTTFASTTANISSRPQTASTVLWDTDNDFPVLLESVSSPDISSVIQEIVDQPDWCGGNSLNIIMESTSTNSASGRVAIASEQGTGQSPQLVVAYDESTATGCVAGELSYQVVSQSNNAEETTNGSNQTGNQLTFTSSSNRHIGLRFNNIGIPQGATISEAYLNFTADTNRTSSGASFTIAASNEADPADFSSHPKYLLRDKPKTSGVTWSNIPAWYRNGVYQSPDITSVVQTIVDRGDWQIGNSLMLIISDIVGSRAAFTYQGRPSGAAELVLRYRGNAVPGVTSTVRQLLVGRVDELNASGLTPVVDTLYEATHYYGGLGVDYGLERGPSSVSSTVRRNTRVSHRLSYVGSNSVLPSGCTVENLSASACREEYIPEPATYISPIVDQQCQVNNHIVLLSDGLANNNHSVSKIESLLGKSCASTNRSGEKCGVDLVRNISRSGDSVIGSRIVTHTIGFASSSNVNSFLNQLALQSGGTFHTASDSSALVQAFQSILRSVKDINATFVSPGVAVNQLNRLTHDDRLYFALFKPAEGTLWPGNLKKYRIDGDTILDQNGLSAVDDGTGFFAENSQSYWSTLTDGNEVTLGGAASRLDLVRDVYTFSGNGLITVNANELHEDNNNISESDLAVNTLANSSILREEILKWARGVDVFDIDGDGDTSDVRLQMGDPIHSQPVIVNYGENDDAIFVATNHGFLHSIDPDNGEENFAVIPKELLSNLYEFYQDTSSFNHIYGLDGDLVLRETENKKYLYVGMRRGGRNYYVFDVTSKTSPSLAFKIEGGSSGYEKLGQSWSRPTLTKIKVGGTSREVMIIGGGYDEAQDSKTTRSADSVGNAVYIIDADDGSLIWSASNADADLNLDAMEYSIPARISVIDRDNDGYADHMYVVDMGAQIFRLDINNKSAGVNDLVRGGLLADFGGEGSIDNRRFYYGPDVAEVSLADQHYYAVALGSGFRAHPLNQTIQDDFFMVKDTGVFSLDEDGNFTLPTQPYTHLDLYNATDHLLTSSDESVSSVEANTFATKSGWFIRLGTGGEKVLASPLIINYRIFFTTYLPASASESACAPPTGNSRAYLVDLVDGNAVSDLNRNGNREHSDRYADLKQSGIAPDTKLLIENSLQPVVCLGTECASAVIEIDENGDAQACADGLDCLAENIYGRFERVQQSTWETETERE